MADSLDDLRAELIALRLLVIRQLRSEFDATNRDSTWESTLKQEFFATMSLLNPRGDPLFSKIKVKGMEIIEESLFGPRPPAK